MPPATPFLYVLGSVIAVGAWGTRPVVFGIVMIVLGFVAHMQATKPQG